MSEETYPDFDDPLILEDENFDGIVWYPTPMLRWWIKGEGQPATLQQVWQTKRLTQSPNGHAMIRPGPGHSDWRDVPWFIVHEGQSAFTEGD